MKWLSAVGQPVATLLEGYDKGVSRYTFTPFSSGVFTSRQEGGKSTGIFFIASGDGSANSGAVIAFSILAFISAITPGYSADERQNMMGNLGFFDSTFLDGKKRIVRTNNVEIKASYTTVMGLIIYIGALE